MNKREAKVSIYFLIIAEDTFWQKSGNGCGQSEEPKRCSSSFGIKRDWQGGWKGKTYWVTMLSL